MISMLASDMDVMVKYADYYLNITRRNPQNIAKALKVWPAQERRGYVATSMIRPKDDTVLVPSRVDCEMLRENDAEAYTYAGCQGITRKRVAIMCNADTL